MGRVARVGPDLAVQAQQNEDCEGLEVPELVTPKKCVSNRSGDAAANSSGPACRPGGRRP